MWLLLLPTSLLAAEPPAKLIDLSSWKLTLPVDTERPGRPDEIRQPELGLFQDAQYFFPNSAADGIVFRAPCGGMPTEGSSYPRCELREMQPGGSQHAAWATDDGTFHTLSLELAITKTPPVKQHVICAQIHDASADVITVRLEGAKLLIERAGASDVILDRNYQLGTRFSLKMQATSGHIKIWRDNTLQLDWPLSRPGCYFKAGCYTQSNPQTGDSPNSYGEVVIYRLHVEHAP